MSGGECLRGLRDLRGVRDGGVRASRPPRPLVVLVLVVGLLGSRGVELGGDQRVVLGAQVDVIVVDRGGGAVGLVAAFELLVALEGLDLLHCHFELMGDPRVGPPLADPGADAVELGSERSACHIGSGD